MTQDSDPNGAVDQDSLCEFWRILTWAPKNHPTKNSFKLIAPENRPILPQKEILSQPTNHSFSKDYLSFGGSNLGNFSHKKNDPKTDFSGKLQENKFQVSQEIMPKLKCSLHQCRAPKHHIIYDTALLTYPSLPEIYV